MEGPNWSLFASACYAYDEKRTDILKPYRDYVYAHGMPWDELRGTSALSFSNMRIFMRSMAATLETNHELYRLFDVMDQTRHHGWAAATAEAGDVLIDRARGKRTTPALPEFWDDTARRAYGRGKESSASYWARAMLRAGHKTLAEPDAGDLGVA